MGGLSPVVGEVLLNLNCVISLLITLPLSNIEILSERTLKQFGFQPRYSTFDAIFVQQSLILEFLSKKKKLYCCFVDYQKAFDSVSHVQLWRRLVKLGITGKLLNVVKSMYRQIKSCVRFNDETSDFYTCYKGLVQVRLYPLSSLHPLWMILKRILCIIVIQYN